MLRVLFAVALLGCSSSPPPREYEPPPEPARDPDPGPPPPSAPPEPEPTAAECPTSCDTGSVPAIAASATGPAGLPNQAQQYAHQAQRFYDDKLFARAAATFDKAYRANPIPDLPFNIAQAFRNRDNPPCAIAAYKAYLDRGARPGIEPKVRG